MRSREQVVWDYLQQWLNKAESDLETARILSDAEVEDYFACAFHSQQAAEKFLKAFLVRHQVEFRKTHDLDELLTLADSIDPSLRHEVGSCVWLSPYGVEFRYPGEYPAVDQDMAERACKESEVVKEGVMKRLEDYLRIGRPN